MARHGREIALEVNDWLRQDVKHSPTTWSSWDFLRGKLEDGAFLRKRVLSPEASEEAADMIASRIKTELHSICIIDVSAAEGADLVITGIDKDRNARVQVQNSGTVTFRDSYLWHISLNNRSRLRIGSSIVGKLDALSDGLSSIHSENSWVYEFSLGPRGLSFLEFKRGGILGLVCPVPGEMSPIVGPSSFEGTFLPRTTRGYPVQGAQPYRSMRYHMTALQNGPATAFFHSAEQGIEREKEIWPNRFFSWLYEEFADYGSSLGLPLAWLVILWVATTTLLFATGVDVGRTVVGPMGWQTALYGTGWWNELLRAAVLGFQPISWLGSLLSPGQAVPMAPKLGLVHLWLVVDGILSTVLLALFIFALRRRFRLAS